MARSKPEWVGKTDDQMPPRSVWLRIFRKQDRRCKECTRKLQPGNITLDHIKPLEDGGENRERNCQLICTSPCSHKKTGEENSRRAKADCIAAKHIGAEAPSKKKSRPFPGSRRDKFKKCVDGTVVLR